MADKKIDTKGWLKTKPLPRKIRKISILEENILGHPVETLIENPENEQRGKVERNPNRELLWKQTNHWNESMEVVRYKDSGLVLVFIQGGVHRVTFKFDVNMIVRLLEHFPNVNVSVYSDRHTKSDA
jgi:hypothetical protein